MDANFRDLPCERIELDEQCRRESLLKLRVLIPPWIIDGHFHDPLYILRTQSRTTQLRTLKFWMFAVELSPIN